MVQSSDLQNLSITSCYNLVKAFFSSQDNNADFSSLTNNPEGVSLLRFTANILSNISYRLVSYMREAFLSTCNLLSSAIGVAVGLGYSTYRGSNQRRLITVNPLQTVVIPKYSVIGIYDSNYDIINIEDLYLYQNEPQDILTVIGKVKTVQQRAGTNDLKTFSFYTQSISEDCILLKDGIEMPTSKIVRDMADDMYLLRTNPFSSVDVQYMNSASGAQYKYSTDSLFTLKYVELADVPTVQYTNSMFTYFTLTNTRLISKYIAPETTSRIKITAPYNHETQNLIRAKKDYLKRLPEILSKVDTSNYNVITPAYAAVTYLTNDYSLLTADELATINTTLDIERFLATPLPDITPPKKIKLTLDISFTITSTIVTLANINSDIVNILKENYYNILDQDIDIEDLEELFEKLSYVKVARVSFYVGTRANNTFVDVGDLIKISNTYYKAADILGETGNTEPLWNVPIEESPEINKNLETVDNGVIWETYKRLDVDNIVEWAANTKKKIGDYVYSSIYPNYMFKVVDLVKTNDEALSAVPLGFSSGVVGDFIEDGEIVWVRKLLNSSYSDRVASTSYRLGDNVKLGNYSYECIGYRGETDSSQPVFELDEYTILEQGADYLDIAGDYIDYFSANDIIQVYVDDTTYYSCSIESVTSLNSTNRLRLDLNQSLAWSTVYTKIKKINIGTEDGNILWEVVPDVAIYSTDWRSYLDIEYNYTTI